MPTRKRPNRVKETLRSGIELADDKNNLEIRIAIDNDDKETVICTKEFELMHHDLSCYVGPRDINVGNLWNKLWKESVGEILMMCSDDMIFRTKGWDTIIIEAFEKSEDKMILVYGRDGIQDENLATFPFIHRKWADCVGYFVPPYFEHNYHDTWLFDIAKNLNRLVYIESLYFEHMHPGANKSSYDMVYHESNVAAYNGNVKTKYDLMLSERINDEIKLKALMK